MNEMDPPQNNLPRIEWRILGELRLRVDSNFNGTLNAWVTKIFGPFSLRDDFVSKVLRSIEEAVARILSLDIEQAQFEYLDIIVLAPAGPALKGQTWGFFQVERTSPDIQNEHVKGYRIEYYMYLDRNSGEYRKAP